MFFFDLRRARHGLPCGRQNCAVDRGGSLSCLLDVAGLGGKDLS